MAVFPFFKIIFERVELVYYYVLDVLTAFQFNRPSTVEKYVIIID